MNGYQTPAPRAAFAVTAFALTALTLALTIVLPSQADGTARTAAAPIEVAINPSRIEVIGVRRGDVASTQPAADAKAPAEAS